MTLRSYANFEERLTSGLKKDMRNLANFHHSNIFYTWWGPFVQSKKCMTLKFTEELCVMTMKNDTKIEEELTCRFKIDLRKILTQGLKSLKKLCFNWLLVTEVYIVWGAKVQTSYLCDLQFGKRYAVLPIKSIN